MEVKRVQVPEFHLVSQASINIKDLRENGRDAVIRNEEFDLDGNAVTVAEMTVGKMMDDFQTLIDLFVDHGGEG